MAASGTGDCSMTLGRISRYHEVRTCEEHIGMGQNTGSLMHFQDRGVRDASSVNRIPVLLEEQHVFQEILSRWDTFPHFNR